MGCADQQRGSIPDAQESRFQSTIHSYIVRAVLQGFRFALVQEFGFQTAQSSDMVYAELQESLHADGQEWRLQDAKPSDMSSATCKRVDLLMLRYRVLSAQNVQKWALLSSN